MNYTIIQPDGTTQVLQAALPPEPTYEQLKAIIAPLIKNGHLERVAVLWAGKPTDMFVDEEGLLKHQPFNRKATEIYWAHAMAQKKLTFQDLLEQGASPIVGTAILFHERVWF